MLLALVFLVERSPAAPWPTHQDHEGDPGAQGAHRGARAEAGGAGVAAKRQAAKTEKQIDEKVGEVLEGRFGTLEIHGGAVLYYQGSRTGELDGAHADSPGGPGFTADLELTWKPALPLLEDGEVLRPRPRRRRHRRGPLRQPQQQPGQRAARPTSTPSPTTTPGGSDTSLNLLEAHYTHEFFDKALNITGGKAKSLLFLDGNAFANNEKQQFVGKPFVNNSVLDSESEYTPLLGGGAQTDRAVGPLAGGHLHLAAQRRGHPAGGHGQEQVRQRLQHPVHRQPADALPQVRGTGGQLPALRLVGRLQPLQARQRPQRGRRPRGEGLRAWASAPTSS